MKSRNRFTRKFGQWIDIAVGAMEEKISHGEFVRRYSNHPFVRRIKENIEVDPSFKVNRFSPHDRAERQASLNHHKRPNYRYRKVL
ncbi:hypothetical protein KAR91_69320 [Candidatus Pacearchaeota archaeon]|nr:hypothetical protein [Candidatus Pacearchaeota archaeon]